RMALTRLNDPSGYYLHTLARPGAFVRKWWHFIYPLWGGSILLILLSAVFWPELLAILAIAFVVNVPVRAATAGRISREVVWFRQVGPLFSAASALIPFDTSETTAITG